MDKTLLRLKKEGHLESRPQYTLRKGTVVLLGEEKRPCRIVDMTTAKMLSPVNGRRSDGSADYYCDGPRCGGSQIMPYEVRFTCLDCPEDFDLCEKCEGDEAVIAAHADGKHVFAKIRWMQDKVDARKLYGKSY
jgi:hypothetical protein